MLGLVDEAGNMVARERYLLGQQRDPAHIVAGLAHHFSQLLSQAGVSWSAVAGVGCSIAAVLDRGQGLIAFAPNIFGPVQNVPWQAMLQQALDQPVWLEMDAQAAALGEAWRGAGAGATDLVYVVVGTGIGAGLVLAGQIYRGRGGLAGELGHTIIVPDGPPCNCGNYGCLEALAAGPAIARRAHSAIQQGQPSLMAELAGDGPIQPEVVFRAARQGDALAQEVVQQTATFLGLSLANVITFLNPQVIALGGGVIAGGADLLLEPIRQAAARYCGKWIDLSQTPILAARLGETAGVVGVARLVWQAQMGSPATTISRHK